MRTLRESCLLLQGQTWSFPPTSSQSHQEAFGSLCLAHINPAADSLTPTPRHQPQVQGLCRQTSKKTQARPRDEVLDSTQLITPRRAPGSSRSVLPPSSKQAQEHQRGVLSPAQRRVPPSSLVKAGEVRIGSTQLATHIFLEIGPIHVTVSPLRTSRDQFTVHLCLSLCPHH